jgi:hypothetical protein
VSLSCRDEVTGRCEFGWPKVLTGEFSDAFSLDCFSDEESSAETSHMLFDEVLFGLGLPVDSVLASDGLRVLDALCGSAGAGVS